MGKRINTVFSKTDVRAMAIVRIRNGNFILSPTVLPFQVVQIHVSAPSSREGEQEEDQLVLEVHATSDLCRQLLLRQEQLQKFLEEQLNEMHIKLNDLLTLLPA